jgi:hypothetical protein
MRDALLRVVFAGRERFGLMAPRSDQRDQISRLISAKKMGLGPAPAQLIGER